MKSFIETAPEAFSIKIIDLFKENKPLLIEAPTRKDAILIYNSLKIFDIDVQIFAPHFLFFERGEFDFDFQKVLFSLNSDKKPDIIVTTPLSRRFRLNSFLSKTLNFQINETLDILDVSRTLSKWGYLKVPIVKRIGEFALRGDILDISMEDSFGFRIEFFDDEIEKVSLFSLNSQRNLKNIDFCTISPLLFSRNLRDDWKRVLKRNLKNASTKKLIEFEEMIESGIGEVYDIYPLICDDTTIEDLFKQNKTIRIEKIKSENYLDEQISILEQEREKKRNEAVFQPFNVVDYFKFDVSEAEIELSSLFSQGENIEKFSVFLSKPSIYERKSPYEFLKKLVKTNTVFLLTKDKNKEKIAENLFENDINSILIEKIPVFYDKNIVYIVSSQGWFKDDLFLNFKSLMLTILKFDLFILETKPSFLKKQPPIDFSNIEQKSFALSSLKTGEYLVHYNYGVAVFEGIKQVHNTDCLVLKYLNNDKIYLPVYNMHLVYKYRWVEGFFPKINSLRSNLWSGVKKKLNDEISKIAEDILQLYASRSLNEGFQFSIDNKMVQDFYNDFPFQETPDQMNTIKQIEKDLKNGVVMDRLLCGDVGFGKTEVAMRACMIAVASGKQAAILVPTTVLAFQHFESFQERFKNFPVKIEMLSRFYSKKEQKEVLKDLKNGQIDIVIGTHRLLSKEVEFKDLGLFIVDEEHRFGVLHKEIIKEMKKNISTLSMTATPIPRTLQLSLLGVREISFIKTPPRERKAVKTYLLEFSEEIIKEAILKELEREGQIYFVHNRVSALGEIKKMIQKLVPGIKIGIAHGQMKENELERVMVDFVQNKYNILLATTLIESGIDIPQVNTIIINRADMFGIAQLYQLRGRVGRWNREAFAYFLVPSLKTITKDAYSRLSVIKRFSGLGSGYEVAMEDLNIRGAGNILGVSQTGKIKGVGYDFYLEMLKRRIEELKYGWSATQKELEIKSNLQAIIPESYIDNASLRVGFYKKLSEIENVEEIKWIKETLEEMFGKFPVEVENLFELTELRIIAKKAGISTIEIRNNEILISISPQFEVKDMAMLFEFIKQFNGNFSKNNSLLFPAKTIEEYKKIILNIKKMFKRA